MIRDTENSKIAPRYCRAEFPAQPYFPGRGPHPTRDPGGYAYGRIRPKAQPLVSEEWRQSPLFLEGVDAMNHRFYWEAHEAWEEQWHANGRRGHEARLLVILIRAAAARLKDLSGVEGGRDRLVRSVEENLEALRRDRADLPEAEFLCGLSLAQLAADCDLWFSGQGERVWLLPGGGP